MGLGVLVKHCRDVLNEGLPPLFRSKITGEISMTAVGRAVGLTRQAVHVWFATNRIPIFHVAPLLNIPGNTLRLADLRPFCAELDAILKLVENERGSEA